MASSVPPARGVAFAFPNALVSQGDTDVFQKTVTLAAGDIQVSKDGAQFVNLATFPPAELDLASGADSGVLWIQLTAAEMTADCVTVLFNDAAGAQWQDSLVTIYTTDNTLNTLGTRILLGVPAAAPGAANGALIAGTNAATTITSAAGAALTLSSTGANGAGLVVSGNGAGAGIDVDGGATGIGVDIDAAGNDGIQVTGAANDINADITGNLSGSVGSIAANGITAASLDPSAGTEITQAVWAEPLPGAYPAGTAGFILGNIAATLTATLTASAAFLAAIAAAVWSYATRTLTSLSTHLIATVYETRPVNQSMEFCQGESPTVNIAIQQANGQPMDITNYTVVWWLTATRGGPALLVRSTVLGNLFIVAPTTGGIQFSLTSAETAALPAATYYHEIHIKSPAGVEYCALHGRVTVSESSIGAI